MTISNTGPVEVRPLRAFVGSYVCRLDECDYLNERLVQRDGGTVVKEKEPRKRFVGLIAVERPARLDEWLLIKAGQPLPSNVRVIGPVPKTDRPKGEPIGISVIEEPAQPTLMLPADIAASLVERGLAERCEPASKSRKAA